MLLNGDLKMRAGALKMRAGGQSDFIMRAGGSARGCSPDPDFITDGQ